ncbi:hypothetical protein NDU88_003249 [Pleurodeles waltl]|uniref:Uncharacterized protein n=1 Tax=Pleurodeles waltl TaxID=8319 RepID=A0AAV7REF7_PLEWA|nr:hypothetical protein NDU88_003249 [Pleurodeles waltl]
MPQSGSPRDSHLPRCSWAILHVLWPGSRHASPKLRAQRSVRAVGHHGHEHPTGGPSIRRSSCSSGGPVLSSFRMALPGPGPFRRCVPVFKVGVRYTKGPFRQTHCAACRVGATARLPAAGPPARHRGSGRARSCRFSLLARMGEEGPHSPQAAVTPSSAVSGTRGFPRSALQQPPGRRGAAPPPQPRSAAPPQTARGPTPIRAPAHSLSPAPGINVATGPRPWGSPAISNGLRQARSGLRWCSGHPHGSPLSLPVNLPRGVAQDNRRSLGHSGADGSSVRHLRLRGHAPLVARISSLF